MSLDNPEAGYVPPETAGDDGVPGCEGIFRPNPRARLMCELWHHTPLLQPAYQGELRRLPNQILDTLSRSGFCSQGLHVLFYLCLVVASLPVLFLPPMLVEGCAGVGVGGLLKTRLEGASVSSEELP